MLHRLYLKATVALHNLLTSVRSSVKQAAQSAYTQAHAALDDELALAGEEADSLKSSAADLLVRANAVVKEAEDRVQDLRNSIADDLSRLV